MALPSTGSISMSQINGELGRELAAQISLDTAENGGYAAINTCGSPYPSSGNPASMSEWRGYNHTAQCCPAYGTYQFSSCGISCLDGDTLITMADGTTKKISEVVKDDIVSSRDVVGMPDEAPDQSYLNIQLEHLNYSVSTAVVRATMTTTANRYYNINNGLLLATESHEHFAYRDGAWRIILSINLRVGDVLLKEDGTLEAITSVQLVNEEKTFYNIDVENLDMYVANGIVTHNAKIPTNPCNRYYWYADGSCGYYYVDQGVDCNCGSGCCNTDVTINWYVPYLSVTCYQPYTFSAAANYVLDTSVTVSIGWYGDLGGYFSGSVEIPVGTTCNSASAFTYGGVYCGGENISYSTATLSTYNYGTQTYIIGTYGSPGFSPC